MTSRQQEICAWVSSLLPDANLDTIQHMQSDASPRKYIRVHANNKSYVIMDTTPGQELINFIKLAQILVQHEVSAPHIIGYSLNLGLALLSDLGDTTYLQRFKNADTSEVDSLYLDALSNLIKMQLIPTAASVGYAFKTMDDDYIQNRLEVFNTWYLQKHLQLPASDQTSQLILQLQKIFSTAFTELPKVFVHVDYHCRNLMFMHDRNPGVLDFQDAMLGPVTYDLVSLLQDAYITWPRSQVEKWVSTYREMAESAGILIGVDQFAILRNFDLVGLQRHIKNLGIFARLHHRDGKSNYLHDMPTLLKYITSTCARYPELTWINEWLTTKVALQE